MAYRVLEVQPTPNPNALKFVLDQTIAEQPTSFLNARAAEGDPLAQRLFAIQDVLSLLFLNDFITINKNADGDWKKITKKAREILETG